MMTVAFAVAIAIFLTTETIVVNFISGADNGVHDAQAIVRAVASALLRTPVP